MSVNIDCFMLMKLLYCIVFNRTTREAIMGDLLHPQDLSEEIPADLDFTKHVYADNNASTNKIGTLSQYSLSMCMQTTMHQPTKQVRYLSIH